MLRNEGNSLQTVAVCTPSDAYFSVADLDAQNINEAADPALTVSQHEALVRVMKGRGVRVLQVPELSGHPNSTFTRDVALSTPEGTIQLRMGLPARRGEPAWIVQVLEEVGEPTVGVIEDPGTVEGGDVVLAGNVAFVGLSERTNREGVRQLGALLQPMGYTLRVCDVPEYCLHLGGAMSAIGPTRVVCCAGFFPDGYFEGFSVVEIPNQDCAPSVANVICLRENEVIANVAENLLTIEILESEGVTVHRLNLSEFRKGAGGPTCMILPVERG